MSRHSSSSSWQLERAQTKLRMRQSQARFWLPAIITVWLLGSVTYLYMSIGETGRAYLPTWLTATFWGSLWPSHLIAFEGHFYDPNTLSTWLQQQIYGNPLSSILIESLLIGTLPALACIAGLILYARSLSHEPREEHIRGVQLMTPTQLQHSILGTPGWWHSPVSPVGMQVAGVNLPHALETSHLAITGSTGTGKSTILRGLLHQIASRGEVAIVLDPECELTPEFYDPQRGDILLNPTDARCPYWSPWLEMADAGDAQTLATSIIPDPAERTNGNEMYFVNSARELFVTLLERLPSKDPQELSRVLFGPLKDLLKLIENTPAASHVLADAPDQRGGVISTLQIALKGFRFLPPQSSGTLPGKFRTWSALTWQDTRQGWLFLPCRESNRASVLSLQSVWLDTLIRRLLDTPLGRLQQERVWIVIDELATLRRLQHLEDIVTRGRKRGVAVVMGFQAVPQLRKLYGRDTTATLLAAPATKLFLRTGEPETAKWCSDAIGSREVVRPAESETAGPADSRDAISVSYQRKLEPLILPSEIQQLPALQGYLSIAGYDVASVTFPVIDGEEKEPGFVPRVGAQAIPPMPPTDENEPPVQPVREKGRLGKRV